MEAGAFTASVDPQVLREMIAQVEFAAASDDSRPVLAGVLIRFEDDRITMAAADGFRLAVREGELATPVPERLDVIVPARALRELARIIGDRTEPIELTITPNRGQLLVHTGETEFSLAPDRRHVSRFSPDRPARIRDSARGRPR